MGVGYPDIISAMEGRAHMPETRKPATIEAHLQVLRDERYTLETEVRKLQLLVHSYKGLLDELLEERDVLRNQLGILSSMREA